MRKGKKSKKIIDNTDITPNVGSSQNNGIEKRLDYYNFLKFLFINTKEHRDREVRGIPAQGAVAGLPEPAHLPALDYVRQRPLLSLPEPDDLSEENIFSHAKLSKLLSKINKSGLPKSQQMRYRDMLKYQTIEPQNVNALLERDIEQYHKHRNDLSDSDYVPVEYEGEKFSVHKILNLLWRKSFLKMKEAK